jgi:hypothetical protein
MSGQTKLLLPSGGSLTIAGEDSASNNTVVLPANSGTAVTTASTAVVTPAMMTQKLTLDTAQATTSGTNKDFTGIPSWVKRITVMLNGTSKTGATNHLIQLGTAGGIVSTGYTCLTSFTGATNLAGTSTSTAGFITGGDQNTSLVSAIFTIVNVSGNIWVASVVGAVTNSVYGMSGGGNVTLSDTLTQVRLTTVSGAATFSTGSVNILYEG